MERYVEQYDILQLPVEDAQVFEVQAIHLSAVLTVQAVFH